jgi:hypothetical protein
MSDVRQTVLEIIKEESRNGQDSFGPGRVKQLTIQRIGNSHSRPTELAFLTFWNELLRGGLIAMGDSNSTTWDPLKFFVTDEGKKSLEHASRDPINPTGYLLYLDQELSLDSVTRGYVEEALNTYRTCCYRATAVLIAAAIERLVLDLRDELFKLLNAKSFVVPKGLSAWQVKTVVEAIAEKLIPDLANDAKTKKDEQIRKLQDDAEARLHPIAAEFRKTRNDAGHPASLDPVHPADVHANLLLFPYTAKLLSRLREWVLTYYA